MDATFCEDLFRVGAGIVVRDEAGRVMLSTAVSHNHVGNSDMAEGLAIVDGMRLVTEMGLLPVILETNSARVFQLLQDGEAADMSELSLLVSKLRREGPNLDFVQVQLYEKRRKPSRSSVSAFCFERGRL